MMGAGVTSIVWLKVGDTVHSYPASGSHSLQSLLFLLKIKNNHTISVLIFCNLWHWSRVPDGNWVRTLWSHPDHVEDDCTGEYYCIKLVVGTHISGRSIAWLPWSIYETTWWEYWKQCLSLLPVFCISFVSPSIKIFSSNSKVSSGLTGVLMVLSQWDSLWEILYLGNSWNSWRASLLHCVGSTSWQWEVTYLLIAWWPESLSSVFTTKRKNQQPSTSLYNRS